LYIALKDAGPVNANALDWNNPYAQRFKNAMDDDFNTPDAIAVLFDLASDINKSGSKENAGLLKTLGGLLGLLQQNPREYLQNATVTGPTDALTPGDIEQLIQQRINARKEGRYSDADAIRKNLQQQGIILEDGAQGTTWRRT
jgi:cysteinyl-tRNA synthetase